MVDIYLMDSLKISVPDEYDDVVKRWREAFVTDDPVMEFTRPEKTVIATGKISAVVNVPKGVRIMPGTVPVEEMQV